ncbi:MAG: nitroreductase [Proteobacteria bacterium]|nr:nitroreductase [Pseudomonadota bacterium]
MPALPKPLSSGPSPVHPAIGASVYAEFAATLIQTRQQFAPKRLHEPGPNDAQVQAMFRAAAAAPDHRCILPWRFVVVSKASRAALGEVFAEALRARDPKASDLELAEARNKAERAPFLALAVVREGGDEQPDVSVQERLISLGCAIQNMLLSAHAEGLGSGLVSGQALQTPCLRQFFKLGESERAVCFIVVGTVQRPKPIRQRPDPTAFVTQV